MNWILFAATGFMWAFVSWIWHSVGWHHGFTAAEKVYRPAIDDLSETMTREVKKAYAHGLENLRAMQSFYESNEAERREPSVN